MTDFYAAIEPIVAPIVPRRQAAQRHYGSHPYFTRRAWNVVRAYIERFSRPGDTVLDPFGGAGVTAIEARAAGRRAIHLDLSPLASFIASIGLRAPVDAGALEQAARAALLRARPAILALAPEDEAALARRPPPAWFPRGAPLPANADERTVERLFTPRQLHALAILLAAIEETAPPGARAPLHYAFSATVAKCNRTFLSARGRKESRGGSAIFSLYRYKVARRPVELDVLEQFERRVRRLLAAKRETSALFGPRPAPAAALVGSADCLPLRDASVDYIFTDPPYGSLIGYLDLASAFHAWLGLDLSPAARRREAIEGGDLRFDRAHYLSRIEAAAREMRRVLRPDRWLSLVFAHRDPRLFEAVIAAFGAAGFSFRSAVAQPVSVVWSMHKKTRPASTIAGEAILSFFAGKDPGPAPPPLPARAIAEQAIRDLLAVQP